MDMKLILSYFGKPYAGLETPIYITKLGNTYETIKREFYLSCSPL